MNGMRKNRRDYETDDSIDNIFDNDFYDPKLTSKSISPLLLFILYILMNICIFSMLFIIALNYLLPWFIIFYICIIVYLYIF